MGARSLVASTAPESLRSAADRPTTDVREEPPMQYIRQVRVDYPGTSNSHITEVAVSGSPSGALRRETRGDVVFAIRMQGQSYRSHNDGTGAEAPVAVRVRAGGTAYIATVADNIETNNLLNLPRF
jgi:hypothetical protein